MLGGTDKLSLEAFLSGQSDHIEEKQASQHRCSEEQWLARGNYHFSVTGYGERHRQFGVFVSGIATLNWWLCKKLYSGYPASVVVAVPGKQNMSTLRCPVMARHGISIVRATGWLIELLLNCSHT